jgi:hypothetical protein
VILAAGSNQHNEAQLIVGLSTADLLDLSTSQKGLRIQTLEMVRRGLPAVDVILVGGQSDAQLERAFRSYGMRYEDEDPADPADRPGDQADQAGPHAPDAGRRDHG